MTIFFQSTCLKYQLTVIAFDLDQLVTEFIWATFSWYFNANLCRIPYQVIDTSHNTWSFLTNEPGIVFVTAPSKQDMFCYFVIYLLVIGFDICVLEGWNWYYSLYLPNELMFYIHTCKLHVHGILVLMTSAVYGPLMQTIKPWIKVIWISWILCWCWWCVRITNVCQNRRKCDNKYYCIEHY